MTPARPSDAPLPATRSRHPVTVRRLAGRPLLLAWTAIAAATTLGALASSLVPALGPGPAPHPTLHGTPSEAAGILATNARTLVVALLLVAGRWHTGRHSRHAGDAIVAVLLLANPLTIGLAIGRYPTALPAYLPHLPLEDMALALAASAWIARRVRTTGAPMSLVRCAVLTLAAAALAAVVETYAVPHRA